MAEYQRIEYRIGPDGQIIETVMDGLGNGCLAATQAMEQSLGEVEQRQFKPEYDPGVEVETTTLPAIASQAISPS